MGGESAQEQPTRRAARKPSRPIEEIKRDLDAVVEEYAELLARLKKEAAVRASRRARRSA